MWFVGTIGGCGTLTQAGKNGSSHNRAPRDTVSTRAEPRPAEQKQEQADRSSESSLKGAPTVLLETAAKVTERIKIAF